MSAPVIGTLCNRNMWVELVSTGPDLLVIFTASSHFPGRGFFGNFSFVEVLPPPPISASIDQNMYPANREFYLNRINRCDLSVLFCVSGVMRLVLTCLQQ